jgi:adenylate cyclase
MCEEYAPQEVNLALNEYLDVVTKAVQKNNGIIDKFIGDAVMALWGVPDKSNRDPLDSVRAALDIRKGMQTLNSTRNSRGLPELHFGIGIHCGPAIFGPVGNAQRVDFTAIGPTINLSARLQSLTKERNADILISSDLYSLVADNTLVQDSGTAQIRGFSESKQVMRLLGVVDQQGVMTFHNAKLEALNLPLRPGVVIEDIPSITSNASKTEGNIKSAS